jgi:hypothetical protein
MSSRWVDDTVEDSFVLGEWSVAPRGKFNVSEYAYPEYVVSHTCKESLKVHPDPWVWRSELHKPCPNCEVVCPDEVQAVFEFMQ